MPDPNNYDNENDWMASCVPALVNEGRDHDQAVAACLDMWERHTDAYFEIDEDTFK